MKIHEPSHRWRLQFEGEWPTSVTFLGNSLKIAAGNRGGQIAVWNLPTMPPTPAADAKDPAAPNHPPSQILTGHTNGISHLVATVDGQTLISASLDGSVRVWDMNAASQGTTQVVLDRQDRARRAKQKRDSEKQAILEAPGIDVDTLTSKATLDGHRDWVGSLGISRDESRLISGDVSSQVITWDFATHQEVSRWSGHPWNWIVATALSPDGQTALVSEYTYKRDDFDIPCAALKLWNTADGREKLDLLKLEFPKLDPQATSYGAAQIWRTFVAGGLIAADFSPDGKLVAVGQGGETNTGKVHLLDTATGKLLRTVSGHRYGVCDVKFSADGQYLLSSGRDTMIRICQVSDGKEVVALGKERGGQFKDWIHALAIAPDQQTIAGADIAGYIHVWQM